MLNVSITDEDMYLEQANEDGLWEPFCPYCGDESGARVEPDAYYTVVCESCGKKFKVEGM